jgi:UDP:flavonoid glycosyltransferase YjiC (YdhE family)
MSEKSARRVQRAIPRRITLLAIGSLGDILPVLALGAGLKDSGHQVTVATHGIFSGEIDSLGFGFREITINPRSVLESEGGMAWLRSQANPIKSARTLAALIRPVFRDILDESWQACQGADALIFSGLALWGHDIAVSMKVPYIFAPLYPLRRSRSISAIGAAPLPLGAPYNLLTHLIYQQLNWQPFRDIANAWRTADLGLPPSPIWAGKRIMGWPEVPIVYSYSSAVLPKPRDWAANQHVTGYWFLDRHTGAREPHPRVAEFVESGPPPVYIGFGSMTDPEPERLADIALQALQLTGQRAVLLSGWAKLPFTSSDNVMVVDSIPHDWLFPRVAAAVHHAGAGTTAAALRAGVPSVTVPYFLDQPLWAHQVMRLGAGTHPIPRKKLTARRLAAALREATGNPSLRARAQAISSQIRAEDGVASAVDVINSYLNDSGRTVAALT